MVKRFLSELGGHIFRGPEALFPGGNSNDGVFLVTKLTRNTLGEDPAEALCLYLPDNSKTGQPGCLRRVSWNYRSDAGKRTQTRADWPEIDVRYFALETEDPERINPLLVDISRALTSLEIDPEETRRLDFDDIKSPLQEPDETAAVRDHVRLVQKELLHSLGDVRIEVSFLNFALPQLDVNWIALWNELEELCRIRPYLDCDEEYEIAPHLFKNALLSRK